ncbi:hypothetical protein DL766_005477 [Monosporascus sp. MC13-8B]|uniref:Uncharacterized protein n=1 Tax=Monosporascus cannonballus TaxID=155416 RepID=A0ABY0H8J0_9PEZI|nr:hypothetical protein DL763_010388 [Monosporascus cannonballus]RYO87620.1 hypothetical protein DL762_004164 [Monosporascus cannonballus]RYP29190.1 hypothetical protein DL766_005477 [Monosporascus sp. MC13-8B]
MPDPRRVSGACKSAPVLPVPCTDAPTPARQAIRPLALLATASRASSAPGFSSSGDKAAGALLAAGNGPVQRQPSTRRCRTRRDSGSWAPWRRSAGWIALALQ